MATSIFTPVAATFMDQADPTFSVPGIWNLGVIYLGGAKTFMRRVVLRYDLSAPDSGPAIASGDSIVEAFMEVDVNVIDFHGPPLVNIVERLTRDDMTSDANWTRYKIANNWTVAGGDNATPPTGVLFDAPAAVGLLTINSLRPFIEYARDNTGFVNLRLRLLNEAPAYSFWYSADIVNPTRPYLYVVTGDPVALDADTPHGATLGSDRASLAARPQRGAGAAAATGAARATRAQGNHGR